jgi:hypothetical protein
MAFDQSTRNRLNRFVADSRGVLAIEFTRQLQATYGMNPVNGEVADINSLTGLTPHQQETAQLLRDTFEHYLAANDHTKSKSKEKENRLAALDRIVREQAFTVLNRLAALRMSEARGFLTESLANGYDSKGFQLFHRIAGTSLGETGEAYTHYLFSIFDEFTLDLSVLFDRFAAQGRLFPSTPVLLELLALINNDEVAPLWAEDETIGWIYQYFNSQEERKKMRDASQAPRNSRELAVRNQFFTPRYVVEFLTDNTLGRIWYEMTKGQTKLVDECEYLVKRPNEIFLNQGEQAPEQAQTEDLSQEELLKQTVYIEHRALKDPRDIRMLDPACGSMHFGLYCFDLFERIYDEAWDLEAAQGSDVFIRENTQLSLTQSYNNKAEFLTHVPRLIIEHNIHGVDIDPRASQVAGMSLWQRAHNSWQQAGIKPQLRPQITKSNIVCAEPMPGEKELLQEFASQLKPTVLGQLVEVIFEKMQLAGEAGTLLKIEKEIEDAIAGAKAIWQQQNQALSQFPDLAKVAKQRGDVDFDVSDIDDEGFWQQAEQKILDALAQYASSTSSDMTEQKRLFASDASKGFAFIDLCKKRFDVVLMNPPFGEAGANSSKYIAKNYNSWAKNILCPFFERMISKLNFNGLLGAIFDRTVSIKSTYEDFRKLSINGRIAQCLDTGWGILDANVETTCMVLNETRNKQPGIFFDFRDITDDTLSKNMQSYVSDLKSRRVYIRISEKFKFLPNNVISYDFPDFAINAFSKYPSLTSSDLIARQGHALVSEQHFRNYWEAPTQEIFDMYELLYNGGSYKPFYMPYTQLAYKSKNDNYWYENKSTVLRNPSYQGNQGIGFGKRGEFLDAHPITNGTIFTTEGQAFTRIDNSLSLPLLAYINSNIAQYLINLYCGQHKYSGYVNLLPFPTFTSVDKDFLNSSVQEIIKQSNIIASFNECNICFAGFNTDTTPLNSEVVNAVQNVVTEKSKNISELFKKTNKVILKYFSIEDHEYEKFEEYEKRIPKYEFSSLAGFECNEQSILKSLISYMVGAVFGRWSLDSTSIRKFEQNEKQLCPTILNFSESNQLILNADELKGKVLSLFKKHIDNDKYLFNFDAYFSKSSMFFDSHLKAYSKTRVSPVYWPLQSQEFGETFWLYYQNLNEQTLLLCINEKLEPKIDELTLHIETLSANTSRTSKEDTELNLIFGRKDDLELMAEELNRLSKFWRPNLNDGVLITAAPLWRLFQHTTWQKKLKQTWEKLQGGEYDWAHLAFSIWPERVLKKCLADRSLAIAHDIENDLWHEVEVLKKNKKEPVWEWQPKPFSDSEMHAYIKEKIATDERLKLYRSNQANNVNGGKL